MKFAKIKLSKKILIPAAGIIVLLAAVIYFADSGKVAVDVFEVKREAFEDTYTETGIVKYGEEYHIIADVSGNISEIFKSENDKVRTGDVILQIDSKDYEREKNIHDANLAGLLGRQSENDISKLMAVSPTEYLEQVEQEAVSAKAALSTASTDYEAAQALAATGGVSNLALEQARAGYESSKLAYESANNRLIESRRYLSELQASGLGSTDINKKFYESSKNQLNASIDAERLTIQSLEEKIENCAVKATCDGVLTSLPAKNVSFVSAGKELASIKSDNSEITVETEILTNAVSYIKTGSDMKAILNLRGTDVEFAGSVLSVYDFATEQASALGLKEYRVKVISTLPDDEAARAVLKNGYGVDSEFVLFNRADALVIPVSSIFRFEDKDYVYRAEGGKAVKTEVVIAYKSNSEAVVDSGLAAGDKIVENVDIKELFDGSRLK